MKRNLFATLLLSGMALPALAQPTYTAADINPIAGDVITMHYNTSLIDPGPSGANKTWNFGSAVSTTTMTTTYTDCSGVSDCSTFPGTTVVGLQSDGAISYIKATGSVQAIMGIKAGPTTFTYADPEELLRFPLAYNNNYSDAWATTFSTSGVTWYRWGTTQVTVDGYGTLTTPAGTFTNTLRLHIAQVYKDSTLIMGMPVIIDYTTHNYVWYSAASHHHLFAINQVIAGGTETNSASWSATTLSVNQLSAGKTNLAVYPQPANGQLHLRFDAAQPGSYAVELTDMTGRTVAQQAAQVFPAGSNKVTMDVSHLNGGIYFLQLKQGQQRIATQKVEVL